MAIKMFGYLASLAGLILKNRGVVNVTGEPILSGSPEGKKEPKVSASLGASADRKLQANVKIGNTVETAELAFAKLAVAAQKYSDNNGFMRTDEKGQQVAVKRIGGRPKDEEIAMGRAVYLQVAAQNPDHAEQFAAAVKALVNEANIREANWRYVTIVDAKTGDEIGFDSFSVSTKLRGQKGTDAEKFGNGFMSQALEKYGLAVRSLTETELNARKGARAKNARAAKQAKTA